MKALNLLVFFCLPLCVYSQSWDLLVNSSEDEVLTDALEDADGNFVLCGYIGDYVLDEYEGYLVKVNPVGDTLFAKQWLGGEHVRRYISEN